LEIIIKFFKKENKIWIIGSILVALILMLPLFFLFGNAFNIDKSAFVYLWENLLFDYSLNTFYLVSLTAFFFASFWDYASLVYKYL
jgi:ABC-type Fe3+ transport system permease subunit